MSDAQQAYEAGAALGAAVAAGAAAGASAAGAGAGNGTYTYYNQYFGNTNYNGVTSEDMAAVINQQQQRQLAGLGG